MTFELYVPEPWVPPPEVKEHNDSVRKPAVAKISNTGTFSIVFDGKRLIEEESAPKRRRLSQTETEQLVR